MDLQKIQKVCMLFLPKRFKLIVCLGLVSLNCFGQICRESYCKDSIANYLAKDLKVSNKKIPAEYKEAIQIALMAYPELEQCQINFVVKKNSSPLSARMDWLSVFRRKSNRIYVITISNNCTEKLESILLRKLSFNAQIGVIGHELAHISEFNTKRTSFFIKLALMHLSKKKIDRYEFNTDKRTIDRGLGFQLLCWSEEVRSNLNHDKWGGSSNPKRERYMNPSTIRDILKSKSVVDSIKVN